MNESFFLFLTNRMQDYIWESSPPSTPHELRRLRRCSIPDPFNLDPNDPTWPPAQHTVESKEPKYQGRIQRRCQYCRDWVLVTNRRDENGFCFSMGSMFHCPEQPQGPHEKCVRCHQVLFWNERMECPAAPYTFCDAW